MHFQGRSASLSLRIKRGRFQRSRAKEGKEGFAMIGRWMPASRREARMASARCMSATSRAPSSRSGRGCGALASPRFCETARRRRGSWSAASAEGGKGFGRAPAPSMEEQVEEIKARDMLIDALLEAAQGGEGPVLDIVSESLFALDKDFWMRFAMRTDSCETAEDKERMADLATLVMKFTEAMVKQSEKSLDSAQTWLIQLLKEAANDKGQWHLPLNEAEIERMRTFLKTKLMDPQPQSQSDPEAGGSADLPPPCDMESLLATSYAWMRKATNDEENKEAQQVVPLLQKVLQLYASEYLLNFSQGDLGMLQVRPPSVTHQDSPPPPPRPPLFIPRGVDPDRRI